MSSSQSQNQNQDQDQDQDQDQRRDRRLLFGVASLVIAGAVGVTFLASRGEPNSGAVEARAVAARGERSATAGPVVPGGPGIVAATDRVEGPATDATSTSPPAANDRPGEPREGRVDRALAAYAARDYAPAAEEFAAEVRDRPDRAWSHYMLGLSLWKAGRADEAVPALERAAALDPGSIRTRVNLSRVENDRGDHEAGLQAARAALAVDPEDGSALFLEGRSLSNLGRLEEAADSTERSLESDPGNGFAQNLLGLILLRQGRAEEAATVLAQATANQPGVAYIENNLGMALELTGRRGEAVAAYRRATETDPRHLRAAANRARLEASPVPLASDPLDRPESMLTARGGSGEMAVPPDPGGSLE